MYTALKQLGFKPNHKVEIMKNPSKNLPVWSEGLAAKYLGQGKAFGLEEFDALLGQYDVSSLTSNHTKFDVALETITGFFLPIRTETLIH